MRVLLPALVLTALPVPAIAQPPAVFVAVLAEQATGFATLAECERAIARKPKLTANQRLARHGANRGSLFNRIKGNTTRCEMVGGEALTVVVPKGL